MCEPNIVGEDEPLVLDVDVVDVAPVDDKASADADEQIAFGAELVVDHTLNLT